MPSKTARHRNQSDASFRNRRRHGSACQCAPAAGACRRKYKKLSDEIRVAEGRLIYARWRDAAAAADQARRDSDAAEAAVKAAQQELEALSLAQTEVATRVAAARSDAQTQREALAEVTATQVRLQGEERAALQRLDDLAAQQRRIADDRAHEGELAREAHAALTALDTESKSLAQDIAGHDAGKAALAEANLAAQSRLRDAEVALAQARAKAASEAADRRIAVSARDSAEAAVRRVANDKARVDAEDRRARRQRRARRAARRKRQGRRSRRNRDRHLRNRAARCRSRPRRNGR
jgi:chromosome segregation protein